ncbi:hypothetical protein HW130_11835 [Streptomyces sp. PKU-EA00015]|nr:hypothetical protein [Streptomyces sp. PKU-EA00015]NWF26952.1 hypothetical protein [Streptomyces sp. PKU-EA00015]
MSEPLPEPTPFEDPGPTPPGEAAQPVPVDVPGARDEDDGTPPGALPPG